MFPGTSSTMSTGFSSSNWFYSSLDSSPSSLKSQTSRWVKEKITKNFSVSKTQFKKINRCPDRTGRWWASPWCWWSPPSPPASSRSRNLKNKVFLNKDQSLFEQRTMFIFQSLPATPYFKMIDIWLFFSMNLMVGSNHRQSTSSLILLGCMPDLPHLSGICRPNSGEERKEVPYL